MIRTEIQSRIKVIREELENRHKHGTVKIAQKNGEPIPIETLQKELYSLIYKSSKLD